MPMVFIEFRRADSRPAWQVLGDGSKILQGSSPAAYRRRRLHGTRHVRTMSEEQKKGPAQARPFKSRNEFVLFLAPFDGQTNQTDAEQAEGCGSGTDTLPQPFAAKFANSGVFPLCNRGRGDPSDPTDPTDPTDPRRPMSSEPKFKCQNDASAFHGDHISCPRSKKLSGRLSRSKPHANASNTLIYKGKNLLLSRESRVAASACKKGRRTLRPKV